MGYIPNIIFDRIERLLKMQQAQPFQRPNQASIDQRHFIIIRNGYSPPQCPFKHESMDSAKKECQRLATMYPGETFIIYESILSAKVRDPIEWREYQPF